jgi:hypothetical protein
MSATWLRSSRRPRVPGTSRSGASSSERGTLFRRPQKLRPLHHLVLWLLASLAQRLRFEGTTSAAGPSWRGGRDGPMWPSNRKNWPTSARNHDLFDLLSRLNAHLSRCPAPARPYSAACRNVGVNGICLATRIPPALSSLTVSSAPTSTRQRISHSECPFRNRHASCPVGPRSDLICRQASKRG